MRKDWEVLEMFISLENVTKNSQAFSLVFSPSCTFQEATGLLNSTFLIQLCRSQSQNSWLQGRAGDSLLSSSTLGSLTITPSPLCLTHVWQSTAWSQSDLLGGQPGWIWWHQETWIQSCLWSSKCKCLHWYNTISYLNFLGCRVLVGALPAGKDSFPTTLLSWWHLHNVMTALLIFWMNLAHLSLQIS